MLIFLADIVRRHKQRILTIESTAYLLSTMVCTVGLLILRRFGPVPKSHRSWRNPLIMQARDHLGPCKAFSSLCVSRLCSYASAAAPVSSLRVPSPHNVQ